MKNLKKISRNDLKKLSVD
ncbi:bacteriocin-like protein [Elizabethkingia anophelis]